MISALFRRWGLQTAPLRTARLRLVAITPEMLEGETLGPAVLGHRIRAEVVPQDWPPELWESAVWAHMLAQLRAQPTTFGWHRYMLLEQPAPRLIGCLGGFPSPGGDVEIGYSVVVSEQRRGYASEAAQTLVDWLLHLPQIHSVSAQAFETAPGSIKVMQRCGMRCVGAGDQPGTVRYRRWRGAVPVTDVGS